MAAAKKTVKDAAPPASSPPATAAPEAVAAAAPAEATETSPNAPDVRFDLLIEKLQLITDASKSLIAQVRLAQKEFTRLQKEKAKAEQLSAKAATRKDKKSAPKGEGAAKRNPSGFAKPTKLSEELCSFLGVPPGTEMARTDVTRMLNHYIKEHQLQDPEDKRSIKPNADLQKILAPGDVTYFNLQNKIKQHFLKA